GGGGVGVQRRGGAQGRKFAQPWPIPIGVSVVAQVTMYLPPSRPTPICPQAAGAAISAPRFAERDVVEYRPDSGSASLRLDVEGSDDGAPLLGFVGDGLGGVGGRCRNAEAPNAGEPWPDVGSCEVRR